MALSPYVALSPAPVTGCRSTGSRLVKQEGRASRKGSLDCTAPTLAPCRLQLRYWQMCFSPSPNMIGSPGRHKGAPPPNFATYGFCAPLLLGMSLSLSARAAPTRGDTANVRAAGDDWAVRCCALAADEAKATVATTAIVAKRIDLYMSLSLVGRPHPRVPISEGDSERRLDDNASLLHSIVNEID